MQKATIQVPGLKVSVPLSLGMLPADLVPLEGPAGEPVIDLAVQGTPLVVQARVNGKNYRKMMKGVVGQDPAAVMIILQGLMKPGPTPGGPFVLEGAGFQVIIKAPKPADPADASAQDAQ